MSTNKFIENLSKEELNDLKKHLNYKDVEYRESNQLALLKSITSIKDAINVTKSQINELLQKDNIDIGLLLTYTKKYNSLCEKLIILDSYKTIFGIN